MTFQETLNKHLQAVQTRDLPGYDRNAAGRAADLVMSDGDSCKRWTSSWPARDWFASHTWSIELAVISTVAGSDLGLAVLRLDYRDLPSNGAPIHEASYLTLAFQRQGDRWVMVHDQNTPIKR